MTIYDADHQAELNAQEEVLRQHNQAVNDSVAEGQESEPEEVSEEVIEQVQDESHESAQESDADRNWRAMREKEREMQAELARLREEHAYLKGQFESNKQPQKEENPLDDDDLLSVRDGKRLVEDVRRQYEEEIFQMKLEREENKMRSQHPDYDEVLEKYSIPLLQQNPDFARGLENAQNKAFYAYQIGRGLMLENRLKEVEKSQNAPQRDRAERIVQNARRPGTLSNVGGGQQAVSKADYWASMSDTDFMKEVQKNLGEI